MRAAARAFVVVAALLVWTTWGARVRVVGAAPDPVLVVIVAVALLRGAEPGAVVGAAAGLGQDLAAGTPLGLHGLVGAVVGTGVGLARGSLYMESAWLPAALTFLVGGAAVLLEAALLGLTAVARPGAEALARLALVTGCYNMAVAPPIFALVRRMEAWLDRRETAG